MKRRSSQLPGPVPVSDDQNGPFAPPRNPVRRWADVLLCLLGIVAVALVVFHPLLGGGILFTTDDNIGINASRKAVISQGLGRVWVDTRLWGYSGVQLLTWTNGLLRALPLSMFHNWVHAIDLGLASIFFCWFLMQRGLSWRSALFGVVTAFWLGTNLTLTYAGHIGKYGVLLFAACFLPLATKAARERSPWWGALAGGALGAMFLEQQDVALFFAVFLGPFVLLETGRLWKWQVASLAKVILPIVVVATMVGGPSVVEVYRHNVKGIAVTGEASDPRANWQFSTQWSVPPDESLDFVAPGYYGWRSGEPEGPYWGRTGRAEGWEQTGSGFMNFRLESVYIGALPLATALLAAALAFRRRRGDEAVTPASAGGNVEVVFWAVVATCALLLSFGKFFPLYRAFYALPGVSAIRCPNKFLHVFQLGVGVLSAYGFAALLELSPRGEAGESQGAILRAPPSWRRAFAIVAAVTACCFLGGWLFAAGMSRASVASLASAGWGAYAGAIVRNKANALLWAAGMSGVAAALAVAAGSAWWLRRPARLTVQTLVLGVMVLDAGLLARHYIELMPIDALVENDVVRLLKRDEPAHRATMVTQAGFYNSWLTFLFPYHDVKTTNIAQMPRMPVLYRDFLDAVGRHPLRLWQLAAVGYVLAPGEVWKRMQSSSRDRDAFEHVLGYDAVPSPGGVAVVPSTAGRAGQHVVLRLRLESWRCALLAGWRGMTDTDTLASLADERFPLFRQVLLTEEDGQRLPPSALAGVTGRVDIVECRSGYFRLRTAAPCPTVLRVAEKYEEGWRAWVDTVESRPMRSDFAFLGVFLTEGEHEVVLRYAPGYPSLWIQTGGLAICGLSAVAAVGAAIGRSRQSGRATV